MESLQATTENHENCKKNRQRLGNLLKFSESHPNAQGTTAYIAEQWGRRWITIDTSRVALALARTRLMAARNAIRALVDRAPPDLVDIRDMMANFEQSDMNVVFLFKHMLLRYRRYCAAYTEQLLGRTFHLALTGKIKEEIAALDAVANDQWFQAIKPTPLPRLKDYLTISFIEETTKDVAIPPREYDVPHTMCSHPFSQGRRLLSHEVRTARFAGRRAFLDMDNFRSFNHAHAEVVVDRNVLPRFMHCLEAHVYHHGYAYRQGGDEYVILLPAFLPSLTVPFLDDLRLKLSQLEYPEVQQSTTVSIGLCIAEPDCPLTDRELLQLASQAKKFAKDAGKDRIATYSRFPFSKETLSVVAPNEMIRSSQCT